MGPLTRFLMKTFHLEPGDLSNLTSLYFATFVMRAAAFAGVAVMQHVMYPDPKDAFWKGLLFAVYPLAEITTVGYFGALCDRMGRKRILVLAHLITAAAVFLFIPSIGPPTPDVLRPYLVAVFFAMFGIGAAAKVASTLAMVNDHANVENRAQLFAFFDLVTFGGLVGGFGAGFLALPLGGSLAFSGRLSDRARLRRPFMALGLACFGGISILFAAATAPSGTNLSLLVSEWPLIAILAAGAGTFPPAALAYLGDIVERAVSGTTFGIYSIIFGSGLIIGPILGGALTEAVGSLAFAVLALSFIGISGAGVAFIREPAKEPRRASPDPAGPPDGK